MEALSRGCRGCRQRRLRLVCRQPGRTFTTRQHRGKTDHGEPVEGCTVAHSDYEKVFYYGIDRFRKLAFESGKPLVMKAAPAFVKTGPLTALTKWFDVTRGDRTSPAKKVMTDYLRSFLATPFPYELTYPQHRQMHGEAVHNFITSLKSTEDSGRPTLEAALARILESHLPTTHEGYRGNMRSQERVLHLHAPLALLDTAVRYNLNNSKAVPGQPGFNSHPLRKLYIAQAPLNDLPKELQDDVPIPRLVQEVDKGDIYGSSIWLGLEPTYTPLHRDPNPNLFVQLCGSKVVRLLPPADGYQIYANVQDRLGRSTGNSRIRGAEMMEGEERAMLYDDIWKDRKERDASQQIQRQAMLQATLEPGDALFIPQGWWHSVQSTFADGRLNGSVNWWFR